MVRFSLEGAEEAALEGMARLLSGPLAPPPGGPAPVRMVLGAVYPYQLRRVLQASPLPAALCVLRCVLWCTAPLWGAVYPYQLRRVLQARARRRLLCVR